MLTADPSWRDRLLWLYDTHLLVEAMVGWSRTDLHLLDLETGRWTGIQVGIDAVTDLNVTALTRLTRAFLPDMLVRGHGGIINIASLGGFLPGPYQAAYYATKAHVISLTRAIAWENRGRGVRITTVVPGPVNTAFHARAHGETSLYRRILPGVSPEKVARATRRGYALGLGIIVPGVFPTLLSLAVRILPGALTIPAMAFLLNPRS